MNRGGIRKVLRALRGAQEGRGVPNRVIEVRIHTGDIGMKSKSRLTMLRRRIGSIRLKYKIPGTLLLAILFSILTVGLIAFQIAAKEVSSDAEQAVRSIEEQGARSIEDRVFAYEESTYQMLQTQSLAKVLGYSREEALRYRTRNEGLPAAIAQQRILYQYTRYAALRANSGYIYDYCKYGDAGGGIPETDALFEAADFILSPAHPIVWTRVDGKPCFLRKYVDARLQEKGVLVCVLDETFFDYVGEEIDYLSEEGTIVLSDTGELLRGDNSEFNEQLIRGNRESWSTDRDGSVRTVISGKAYYASHIRTPRKHWELIMIYPEEKLLRGVRRIHTSMLVFLAAALMIGALTAWVFGREVSRDLGRIEEGLAEYEKGNFDFRIHPQYYDEIGLLGLEVNHMAARIGDLVGEVHRKEEEKRELEVQTLQAQINPHFLYNTLGSLKWAAVRNGYLELANSLDAMVELLRFTIKKAGSMVPLKEEIRYIQNYEAIEKMRYGDHFMIEYDISPDTGRLMIPGFILQPIVENSLLHGIDMTKDDGYILIRSEIAGAEDGDYLRISVADNGVGMDEEKAHTLLSGESEKKKGGFSSIGVRIVDRRLKELYGIRYRTEITTAKGQGCETALWIPCDHMESEIRKEGY